jgi:hypothetical protein
MIDLKVGEDYIRTLHPTIYNSIFKYTTDYFKTLNNSLEVIDTETDLEDVLPLNIIQDIRNIDYALDSAPPLTKDLVVYRGLHFHISENPTKNKIIMGNAYKGLYKGYLSTSINKEIAYEFGKREYQECIIMKIHIKKGTRVLFLNLHSATRNENEVLLPRNTVLEIYSIKKDTEDDLCTYIKTKLR